MYNETSADMEKFTYRKNANIQYTAPCRYCAPAEQAVLTIKPCFKSTSPPSPRIPNCLLVLTPGPSQPERQHLAPVLAES